VHILEAEVNGGEEEYDMARWRILGLIMLVVSNYGNEGSL
jgi:hypothetical protein